MKGLVHFMILSACMLVASHAANAQDCSDWSNRDLRGTYTMTGSGWIDLSKMVPTLPPGSIPMSWAGAFSWDGEGKGTGWVSINAGGVQMNIAFVNMTYDMKPDCSVAVSYSSRIKELGTTLGPDARILVVTGTPAALGLDGIQVGAGPGTMVDLLTARRISMRFK